MSTVAFGGFTEPWTWTSNVTTTMRGIHENPVGGREGRPHHRRRADGSRVRPVPRHHRPHRAAMSLLPPIANFTLTQKYGASALGVEPAMFANSTRAYWQPFSGGAFYAHFHPALDM